MHVGSSFVLKSSLSTSLQKLYVPIQHYSHFFNKVVWMTVQIMLTAESLLPACERTAMHEKKGLNAAPAMYLAYVTSYPVCYL